MLIAMPTQLKTRCPHCQGVVKVSESHVGQRIDCPTCHQSFDVSSVEIVFPDSASLERAPAACVTMNERASDTAATDRCPPQPVVKQSSGPAARLGKLGRFELKELLGQGA